MSEQVSDEDSQARYECRCGNVVTVSPRHFSSFRWVVRKFGYRNQSHALGELTECCDWPEYMETSGYD